jgi:hypothetical protein
VFDAAVSWSILPIRTHRAKWFWQSNSKVEIESMLKHHLNAIQSRSSPEPKRAVNGEQDKAPRAFLIGRSWGFVAYGPRDKLRTILGWAERSTTTKSPCSGCSIPLFSKSSLIVCLTRPY